MFSNAPLNMVSDLFFSYTELYDHMNNEKVHAEWIERKVTSFTWNYVIDSLFGWIREIRLLVSERNPSNIVTNLRGWNTEANTVSTPHGNIEFLFTIDNLTVVKFSKILWDMENKPLKEQAVESTGFLIIIRYWQVKWSDLFPSFYCRCQSRWVNTSTTETNREGG